MPALPTAFPTTSLIIMAAYEDWNRLDEEEEELQDMSVSYPPVSSSAAL
jgi:hypothetical protein